MELTEIIKEIEKQKDQLEQVLTVLSGKKTESAPQQSTVNKVVQAMAHHKKHHTMSRAGRKKVAEAQKARWAKIREERNKAA